MDMAEEALEPKRRNIKARPIRIDGDLAYVPLTKGLEAVIDAADVHLVSAHNWYAHVHKTGHAYAARSINMGSGCRTLMLHRVVVGEDGGEVDHINGDGLDNRRANLRICTHQQNMHNRVMDRRNTLGSRGVWIDRGKFRATIKHNNKSIHLGRFPTKEEAAAAYTGAAKALFGKFSPV
jgi:hypothetical protein